MYVYVCVCAYPHPSLRMGCIKDKKDNAYCAVKRAAIAVKDDVAADCTFYLSWCV